MKEPGPGGDRGTALFASKRMERSKPGIPLEIRIPTLFALPCVLPVSLLGDGARSESTKVWQANGNDTVVLDAGDQAQIMESEGKVRVQQPLTPAEVQRFLQWREGRLVFDGDPLTEVVAEFNRYNTAQLVIRDVTLAELKIEGTFQARDLKGFLFFLQSGRDFCDIYQ
jgi:hypothetical protein